MAKKKRKTRGSVVKDLMLLFGALRRWAVEGIRDTIRSFPVLVERLRNLAATNLHLGVFHLARGSLGDAAYRFRLVNYLTKGDARAWYYLGICRLCQDRDAEAAQAFEEAVRIDPAFTPAAFLRGVIQEPGRFEAVPEAVSKDFYDTIAEDYETLFVKERGYDAPAQAFRAAEQFLPQGNMATMLDLACGTGLAGEAFASRAHLVTGVDISPRMLEIAAGKSLESGRKVYEALHEASAAAFLTGATAGGYDVVTAIHALQLLRDLGTVFQHVAPALKPGGIFVFTVRAAQEGAPSPDVKGGWFAHGREAVEAAAQGAGFTRLHLEETMLMEGELGMIGVFGKPAA
ncbi:MAG: methyltransferase domain-containing protein [Alphaproteobacteria bacterium]|nr:methyltransferase domain-containing protein [Alphaproteobacteria bacterium]